MGTGFSKKKKQAKMLQDQFGKMQDQLQNSEFIGSAGNGLVTVTITGQHELKDIKIKPECVDPEDIEGLQDLIKAAFKDATTKANAQSPQMPQGLPNLGSLGF